MIVNALIERYRCSEALASFAVGDELLSETNYLRFGSGDICYGQSSLRTSGTFPRNGLCDLSGNVDNNGTLPKLPFDPCQMVDHLRMERYAGSDYESRRGVLSSNVFQKAYYSLRPLLDVPVRKHLQRWCFRDWEKLAFPAWPVDRTVECILERLLLLSMKSRGIDRIPFIWFWPEGFESCVMVTHDVETKAGADFTPQVLDMDDSVGIKSSFQVIPEKQYPVSAAFLNEIRARGFELNVHDLRHDGNLFDERESFLCRAQSINRYLREYGAQGFRAGRMYRNADWIGALDILYDMSVPSVAHLEPQRGGCCTVFPYYIGGILELPLTTTQDYSLFHILGSYSTELWLKQISLITESHGLVSVIIHPDHIIEKRAREAYKALLRQLILMRDEKNAWVTLPREVNRWWRARSQMKLVQRGGTCYIEGAGSERARVAYASFEGDQVVYTIANKEEVCVPRYGDEERSRVKVNEQRTRRHRP